MIHASIQLWDPMEKTIMELLQTTLISKHGGFTLGWWRKSPCRASTQRTTARYCWCWRDLNRLMQMALTRWSQPMLNMPPALDMRYESQFAYRVSNLLSQILTAGGSKIQNIFQVLISWIQGFPNITAFIVFNHPEQPGQDNPLGVSQAASHGTLPAPGVWLRSNLTPLKSSSYACKRPLTTNTRHTPVQNDKWYPGNNSLGRKRGTCACKVCSLLIYTGNAWDGDSSIYCSSCKRKTKPKKPKAARVFSLKKWTIRTMAKAMFCWDLVLSLEQLLNHLVCH